MSQLERVEQRWREEAAFFDSQAAARGALVAPISPAVVQRYREHGRRNAHWPKEHALGLLGDLRGKRVLDVGAGEGQDSVLLAKLGAQVVAVELSPLAIAHARRFGSASGVAAQIEYVNLPVEQYPAGEAAFDVVWCDAVVHHVLASLPAVLAAIRKALKPGGVFVAIEPLRTSPVLRALRSLFPRPSDVTPDERPLQREDVAVLRSFFGGLEVRYFSALSRLSGLLLRRRQFETASPAALAALRVLTSADRALLNGPALESVASIAVFAARVAGA